MTSSKTEEQGVRSVGGLGNDVGSHPGCRFRGRRRRPPAFQVENHKDRSSPETIVLVMRTPAYNTHRGVTRGKNLDDRAIRGLPRVTELA